MFSRITRWATIAGGFAVAAIMTAELFVDDPSSFREVTVFNFILVWSMAWFLANAIRFFDTRNERWLRLFGLLSLGLALASLVAVMLVNLEFPITGSNASEVSLSASALIFGFTALFSAIRVPPNQAPPNWSFDLIGSIRRDPLRWTTIASGLTLAVFISISPTFIPTAVAATCLVRYADTMTRVGRVRLVGLMAVAFVLASGVVVLWSNSFEYATLPTSLLIIACILAMFRRREAPDTPAGDASKSVGVASRLFSLQS